MSNFQLLEVVDRGSETQPLVVENLNRSSRIRVNYVNYYCAAFEYECVINGVNKSFYCHDCRDQIFCCSWTSLIS